jgi:hypothetical protein
MSSPLSKNTPIYIQNIKATPHMTPGFVIGTDVDVGVYVASMPYKYEPPALFSKERNVVDNPLGVKVTGFVVDQELKSKAPVNKDAVNHTPAPSRAIARFALIAKEHPEAAAYDDVALKRLLFMTMDVIDYLKAEPGFDADGQQIGKRQVDGNVL